MAMEQLEEGTKVTWYLGRGRGHRKVLTGRISDMSYQDNPISKIVIDTDNPDDDLVISVDNAVDSFGNPAGNKWFYASQLINVG